MEDEIREALLRRLESVSAGSGGQRPFLAGDELELAVRIVHERISKVLIETQRMNSVELALSNTVQNKAAKSVSDFSQNNIRLTSLVPPAGGSGLCPLPNRVDCLTGAGSTYPEIQLESDLANTEIYSEPVNVALDTRLGKRDPSESVVVKRMRIKNI